MKLTIRNGTYGLRKQINGKREEISFGTDKKRDAETAAIRFLATLQETGSWDTAAAELRGKPVLKKGESPTFEMMKELYTRFVATRPQPIRKNTFATNISSLRRLMMHLKAKTVADIDQRKIKFTAENRATIISQIKHSKAIFKPSALAFYNEGGAKVANPFTGMELGATKVNRYNALPQTIRKAIEAGEGLEPSERLIVILALEIGLRKNEIDKARLGWLRDMGENTNFVVPVKEEDFAVKNGISREIPITRELAAEIFALREQANPTELDPYIVPGSGRGAVRHDKAFRRVNEWIKEQGVKSANPLHSLRKEFGSHVFTLHGVGVACKLLGHADIKLTASTYAGLTATPLVDVRGLAPADNEAAALRKENAELKELIAKLAAKLA